MVAKALFPEPISMTSTTDQTELSATAHSSSLLFSSSDANWEGEAAVTGDWSDFTVESVLREEPVGSFYQIFNVRLNFGSSTARDLLRGYDDDGDDEDINDADDDDDDVFHSAVKKNYTLKCLRRNLGTQEIESKVVSLAVESRILTMFAHPNVVQMCRLSSAFSVPGSFRYFVLYEPIDITLETMLKAWRKNPLLTRKIPLLRNKANAERKKIKSSLHRRVQLVAMGLIKGIAHVHTKGIALRNLNPGTIGFDYSGEVKLFDFSQASPVGFIQSDSATTTLQAVLATTTTRIEQQSGSSRPSANTNSHLWRRAENTGLLDDDGFSQDVYAFGVIIWLVASLKQFQTRQNGVPFKFSGERVSYWDVPSKRLRSLIEACWEADPNARPTSFRLNMMLLDCYGASSVYEYAHTKAPSGKSSTSNGKRGGRALFSSPWATGGSAPGNKRGYQVRSNSITDAGKSRFDSAVFSTHSEDTTWTA